MCVRFGGGGARMRRKECAGLVKTGAGPGPGLWTPPVVTLDTEVNTQTHSVLRRQAVRAVISLTARR